jgi:hypothetical protein
MKLRVSLYVLAGLGVLLMSPTAEGQALVLDRVESILEETVGALKIDGGSTVLDQMQPIIDFTVGGLTIGGTSEQKLAQTVTAGVTGSMVGVFLPIACATGEVIVEIRALDGHEPGDTVLRRRRVAANDVPPIGPTGARFGSYRFLVPLSLSEGDRFAIVVQNATGSCGMFQGPVGDTYARGAGFFDARPNAPGWVPFSEFSGARDDLPFITEMRLP